MRKPSKIKFPNIRSSWRYVAVAAFILALASGLSFQQTEIRRLNQANTELAKKLKFADTTHTESGNLRVVEVGYEMQLPEDLKDIVYFYNRETHTTFFSTRSLMSEAFLDSAATDQTRAFRCDPGALPLGGIRLGTNPEEGPNVLDTRFIGNKYFTLIKPAGQCGKTTKSKERQDQQAQLLKAAFTTLTAYKEIKFDPASGPGGQYGGF